MRKDWAFDLGLKVFWFYDLLEFGVYNPLREAPNELPAHFEEHLKISVQHVLKGTQWKTLAKKEWAGQQQNTGFA